MYLGSSLSRLSLILTEILPTLIASCIAPRLRQNSKMERDATLVAPHVEGAAQDLPPHGVHVLQKFPMGLSAHQSPRFLTNKAFVGCNSTSSGGNNVSGQDLDIVLNSRSPRYLPKAPWVPRKTSCNVSLFSGLLMALRPAYQSAAALPWWH